MDSCGVLRVKFIPPVKNVTLSVGNAEATLDTDGSRYIYVEDLGEHLLHVCLTLDPVKGAPKGTAPQQLNHIVPLGEFFSPSKTAFHTTKTTSVAVGDHLMEMSVVRCRPVMGRMRTKLAKEGNASPVKKPSLCIMCYDLPRDTRLPCGHCAMCRTCSEKVKAKFGRCPICNAQFDSYETVGRSTACIDCSTFQIT